MPMANCDSMVFSGSEGGCDYSAVWPPYLVSALSNYISPSLDPEGDYATRLRERHRVGKMERHPEQFLFMFILVDDS